MRNLSLSILLAATALVSACGQPTNVVADKSPSKSSADANITVVCASAQNCPAVAITIAVTGLDGGQLVGNPGKAVNWSFAGQQPTTSNRTIIVFATGGPQGANLNGQGTASVTVDWQPSAPQQGTNKFNVVARDVTRCQMLQKDQASACNDPKATQFAQFETQGQYDWSVVNTSASVTPDAAFTTASTQAKPSFMTNCFQGAIPGVFTGIFTGNILGGLGQGCMNGVIRGLSQPAVPMVVAQPQTVVAQPTQVPVY